MEQNNEILNFNHPVFGTVRTMVDEQGEPWFTGIDVTRALGYVNPKNATTSHVDCDNRKVLIINRGTQNGYLGNQHLVSRVNMINESGLYSLILGSKLPSAKKFKHWVTRIRLWRIIINHVPTNVLHFGEGWKSPSFSILPVPR